MGTECDKVLSVLLFGQLTRTFCERLFCSSSNARGQLIRTFCERLFCSSSNARISVSELPSWRVDSDIFLAVCGRLAAVEKTRRERRVHATATSRLRPV